MAMLPKTKAERFGQGICTKYRGQAVIGTLNASPLHYLHCVQDDISLHGNVKAIKYRQIVRST